MDDPIRWNGRENDRIVDAESLKHSADDVGRLSFLGRHRAPEQVRGSGAGANITAQQVWSSGRDEVKMAEARRSARDDWASAVSPPELDQ